MNGGCTECKKGTLASMFEQKLQVCADCCATLVDRGRKLPETLETLTYAHEKSKEMVRLIEESTEAERLGREAAAKGFGEDQNPFRGKDQEGAWDAGWARGELERRTQQAAAVIEWAVLNLDTIQELARGYGQEEIALKVETIAEKLSDFAVVR